MAKSSPKQSKGSPGSKKSKSSKKKSPDKSKAKSKSKTPPQTAAPEAPSRALDLHRNVAVRDSELPWREGPGFTVLQNVCYTREAAQLFRDFLSLPQWDCLAAEASPDLRGRECIHGNCKENLGEALETAAEPARPLCGTLPCWDYLQPPSHGPRDCCLHRGGLSLRDVHFAVVPHGPVFVHTHNLRARAPAALPTRPSASPAYAYLRALGLRDRHDRAILREVQGSHMSLKRVPPVTATMIRRSFSTTKLGVVLSVVPGPYVFVLFVVKNSPAFLANIHYGDQILEVDGLPLNNMLALSRLTEYKSLVINVLYTQCPFKSYFDVKILKGESMGFQIVDGNIIYVKVDSPAYKARLPVDHQIIELEQECVVGLSNLDLQREIRNRASERPARVVRMTLVPRYIYEALTGSMDPKYIRKHALAVYPIIE